MNYILKTCFISLLFCFFTQYVYSQKEAPVLKPKQDPDRAGDNDPCTKPGIYHSSGKVFSEGQPLQGVKYYYYSYFENSKAVLTEGVTNNEGEFIASCLKGEQNISFSKEGYYEASIKVSKVNSHGLKINLYVKKNIKIQGEVFDWFSHQPIVNAKITFDTYVISSDEKGKYILDIPFKDIVIVNIEAPGRISQKISITTYLNEINIQNYLQKEGLIAISGVVKDIFENEPLSNILVKNHIGGDSISMTTDTTGQFRMYANPGIRNNIIFTNYSYSTLQVDYPNSINAPGKNIFDIYLTASHPSLTYLGYDSTYIPSFYYTYLRDKAEKFITNAIQLEKDLLVFREKSDDAEFRRVQFEHTMNIAKKTVEVSRSRVDISVQSVEYANRNLDVAQLRAENKREQVAKFTEFHPLAVARAKATEFGGGKVQGIINIVSEESSLLNDIPIIGGLVSSIFNKERNAEAENFLTLKREAAEIRAMVGVAETELGRERKALESAEKDFSKDSLTYQQLETEYKYFQSGTINEAFWDGMSERASKLYRGYLRYGTILAWLAQRAFEAKYLVNVDLIRYGYTPSDTLLSAQQLLFDLNSLDFQGVANFENLEIPSNYTFTLAQKAPLDLEQFKKTGKISFTITQSDLDMAFPGMYRQMIDNIDLQVIALVPPTGMKGSLTKEGLSWIKVPIKYAGDNAVQDWIQFIPSPYSLLPLKNKAETIFFPRPKSQNLNPDNQGLKRLLEGRGVCGTYTLELPKYSNRLNYNTIVDVIVSIDFSAYEDKNLKHIIEEELSELQQRDSLQKGSEVAYSLSNDFPDEYYGFKNPDPVDSFFSKHRLIPFKVNRDDIDPNIEAGNLSSLSVLFSGEKSLLDINAAVTSRALNPNIKFEIVDGKITFPENAKTTLNDLNWIYPDTSEYAFKYIYDNIKGDTIYIRTTDALSKKHIKFSDDLWIIRIDAEKNTSLCTGGTFNDQKISSINDVVIHVGFRYKLNYLDSLGQIIQTKLDKPSENPYFYYNNSTYTEAKTGSSKWKTDLKNGYFQVSTDNEVGNNFTLEYYPEARQESDYTFRMKFDFDTSVFENNQKLVLTPIRFVTSYKKDDYNRNDYSMNFTEWNIEFKNNKSAIALVINISDNFIIHIEGLPDKKVVRNDKEVLLANFTNKYPIFIEIEAKTLVADSRLKGGGVYYIIIKINGTSVYQNTIKLPYIKDYFRSYPIGDFHLNPRFKASLGFRLYQLSTKKTNG